MANWLVLKQRVDPPEAMMADPSVRSWDDLTGDLLGEWDLPEGGSGESVRPAAPTPSIKSVSSILPPVRPPSPVSQERKVTSVTDFSFHLGFDEHRGDDASCPAFNLGEPGPQSIAGSVSSDGETRLRFPQAGEVVGGFRIVRELGRGAFARVYLAEQAELADRPVALKVAEALGSEPQTLARLQHTHIVPIHSVHDDKETGWRLLCMPYVGGANLAQVLDQAGARLVSQATGRSLIDALDQVGGKPPVNALSERISARRSRSVRSMRRYGVAATRGIGTPSVVRGIWGRYWARLPWWSRLEDESATETAETVETAEAPAPAAALDEIVQPARHFLRSHTYVQAAVWIAARLAEGLEHAHARGMLHRDIKPSNILIAADGTPMLLDFNLAADLQGHDPADGTRAMLGGTLPYMSPEHLDAFNPDGDTPSEAVDERSDLFALGLILFEMLAGHHPFADPPAGGRLNDVLRILIEDRLRGAPPVRASNPSVPWSLDAVVRKCLDPDPDRRYQRARDLAEDLRRFLDDLPMKFAPEPSPRERMAKWLRRHPGMRSAGPVAAIAIGLVTLLGGIAWTLTGHVEQAAARFQFDSFRADLADAQLLLNTSSGPSSHLERGVAKADKALEAYHLQGPGDWSQRPLVKRLPAADQQALREEIAELLLLWTRARIVLADRQKSEPVRRRTLESAVSWLDRAERIDPRPSAALFEDRARYQAALGNAPQANRDRDRAAKTPPRSSRDYYLIGTALAARGQLDQAEPKLSKAIGLDSRRFWAWFALGLCHYDQGRFVDAVTDFTACTLLEPRFAWPQMNRGLALAAAGRLAEASVAYDRAISLIPDFIEARVNRALCSLQLNEPARAATDLDRAIALGRRDPAVLAARAEALGRIGRRADAERDFAEALHARPNDLMLLVARGFARLEHDPAAAASDFQATLRIDPRSARALLGLAYLQRRTDPRAALEQVGKALDAAPNLQEALQLRALLRARLADPGAVADADRLAQTPTPHNLYNAACALAILADTSHDDRLIPRAADLLSRALDAGFPRDQANADPDLQPIRDHPIARSR